MKFRKRKAWADSLEAEFFCDNADEKNAMGLFAVLKKITLPPLVMIEPTDDVVCRRATVRKSQNMTEGYIKSENMAFARACHIMDLSEMGAQLELREEEIASMLLVGEMTLFFCAEQSEVDCTVAWRKGRRLGVRFRGKHRRPRLSKR